MMQPAAASVNDQACGPPGPDGASGDVTASLGGAAASGSALRAASVVCMLRERGSMPICDLLDAHRAACGLLRPVAVREDFGARSLTALVETLPQLALSRQPARPGGHAMVRLAGEKSRTAGEKRGLPEAEPGEGAAPGKRRRKRRPGSQAGRSADPHPTPTKPPSLSAPPPPPHDPKSSVVCESPASVPEKLPCYWGGGK
mmetsp:Transcript_47371/g.153778  ORF Transcript_47371/g.153778 Transcript_47371/m.153778 type:complete len:201 (-) Transcript_47371:3-605(-)